MIQHKYLCKSESSINSDWGRRCLYGKQGKTIQIDWRNWNWGQTGPDITLRTHMKRMNKKMNAGGKLCVLENSPLENKSTMVKKISRHRNYIKKKKRKRIGAGNSMQRVHQGSNKRGGWNEKCTVAKPHRGKGSACRHKKNKKKTKTGLQSTNGYKGNNLWGTPQVLLIRREPCPLQFLVLWRKMGPGVMSFANMCGCSTRS